MPELLLSCHGVCLRVVDAAGSDLCKDLLAALPPEVASVADGPAPAVTLQVAPGTDGSLLLSGGADPRELAGGDDDLLLRCVLQEIDQAVSRLSRERLFVHAAVVGWRGRAIVMPGRSFSGKSTLAAALVRRGAVYYSDEYAVLDAEGRVHPYRRALHLRDEAARKAAHGLRLLRPSEPCDPLPVGVVVSTTHQPGASWRPAVLRGARTALPLIDNTVLAREEHGRALQMAARVAEDALLLQGVRGEADELAARLLDMLDTVAASRALLPQGRPARFADDAAPVASARLAATPPHPLPTQRGLWMVPHVVVPQALPAALHQRLLAFALAHPEGFQASKVHNKQGQGTIDAGYRFSHTYSGADFEPVWAEMEPLLRAMLPAVRHTLSVPWFKLGDIEHQLTAHHDGGFFAPHHDAGSADTQTRKISCVYYFHAAPRGYTGGTLKLFDLWVMPTGTTPAGTYTEIDPPDNTLVFFRSDDHHEVSTVHCAEPGFDRGRFTVVVWFREATGAPAARAPAEPATAEATA